MGVCVCVCVVEYCLLKCTRGAMKAHFTNRRMLYMNTKVLLCYDMYYNKTVLVI